MTRGPLAFKQADVTRVVKAARQAKLENFRVEISKDSWIVLDVKETGDTDAKQHDPYALWKAGVR
jgi:hypothetical protein